MLPLSLLLAVAAPSPAQTVEASTAPAAVAHVDTIQHKDELRRARLVMENALKSDPSNDSLLLELAFIEQKQGDFDAAQADFEKVIALNPGETSAHYMLALLYEKKGEKRRAMESWQACMDRSADPNMRSVAEKHLKELKK
jgi:Tfp pilus assembly protein PilF